jgi:hypothetical protein
MRATPRKVGIGVTVKALPVHSAGRIAERVRVQVVLFEATSLLYTSPPFCYQREGVDLRRG